jgi:hypothetical protein
MKPKLICISLIAFSVTTVVGYQSRSLRITDLMTVEEFRATGMNKLTPEEMKQLDAWLNRYTSRVAKAVLDSQESRTKPMTSGDPSVIESRIDGEFEGWEGDTIFKLENGQIWQQSSYAYTYHYSYRPKVVIYKSGTVYKMKVDDVSDTISVRRLK